MQIYSKQRLTATYENQTYNELQIHEDALRVIAHAFHIKMHSKKNQNKLDYMRLQEL